MLMIQGKQLKTINREIKRNDQIALIQDDVVHYSGCVDMVIPSLKSRLYIIHTKNALIHINVERQEFGGQIYKDFVTYKIFKEDGISCHTSDEFNLIRQFNPTKTYEIFVDCDMTLTTTEQKTVREERPLTIEDKLKYVNDGCTYDILYISPHGNMIIKEQKSGEERVVNKKDRQLQIALGVRNT